MDPFSNPIVSFSVDISVLCFYPKRKHWIQDSIRHHYERLDVETTTIQECGQCNKKFTPITRLRKHMRVKHGASGQAGWDWGYSSARVVGGPRHGSWKQPLASGLAGPSLNSDIPIQSWVVFAWKTGINCVKLRPRRCNSCSYFIIYIVAPYITPHSWIETRAFFRCNDGFNILSQGGHESKYSRKSVGGFLWPYHGHGHRI